VTDTPPIFVFQEASGRRWRRLCRAGQLTIVVFSVALTLVLLSVVRKPELPPVTVAEAEHVPNMLQARPLLRPAPNSQTRNGVWNVQGPSARETPDRGPLVFGFYVNWDTSSLVSLRLHAHAMTHLVPQWFTLRNAEGDLDDNADPEVVRIAAQTRLPILAMVHNFRQGWQREDLHRLLNDDRARRNLIDNIVSNAREHRFAGINVDFEELPVDDREHMSTWMSELAGALHGAGFLVTQSVPIGDPAYDLARLAAVNDYLLVMLYDEHDEAGPSGPVASATWFNEHLTRLRTTVPLDKTIVGIGNYGYDWLVGGARGVPLRFADVMALGRSSRASVAWDGAAGNPTLRYQVGGAPHEVWFLDAVTALNQTQVVLGAGFRGTALWRLGAEDPGVWRVLRDAGGGSLTPTALARLDGHGTVMQYGTGEILKVAEAPRDGARQVARTTAGGFTERYVEYPSYFVIESNLQTSDKTLALTFDDGPDPRYTAQILDVLKYRQVPATFFVVGMRAEQNADLLQRMYAERHEIGNHTYAHPNLSTTWARRTAFELNATQRIIQRATGVSSVLFRPPYYSDSEPQTPEELASILRAQKLGYIAVAQRIDPRDWVAGVTAGGIVDEVVAEADEGRIILLHDGGGDRSATVAALPRMIDALRARGYRFIPVSALMGKTRDEVMPRYAPSDGWWAAIGGFAFAAKGTMTAWVSELLIVILGFVGLRVIGYGALSIWQKRRARRLSFNAAFTPPVSVIIPAHNEASGIGETVGSILASDYPHLEVIVVDDGSTDDTAGVVERTFTEDPRVLVHRQARTGKAGALNRGITDARHDLVLAVDADTTVAPSTIRRLVRHFVDPEVAAVSGNVRVRNRTAWLSRFQSIEYVCAFNLERRALDVVNAITVVPGAIGAWRRDVVVQAGGFSDDTLAEDTDLTLTIRRLGYRIRYEEEAVAYTQVPETPTGIAAQRFRWLFGTLQSAWKHRDVLGRPRYGSLAFVALPSIWLFQLFLPLASPLAEIAAISAVVAGNWAIVALYGALLLALELPGALLAYVLDGTRPRDLLLFLPQRFFYRPLLVYVTAKAFVAALRGRRVDWRTTHRPKSWSIGPPASRPATP